MASARIEMTVALTPDELARSWLVEHYRRQGTPPLRTLVAIGIVVLGAMMLRQGAGTLGPIAIAWGSFLTLRPLATAAWLRFSRTPPSVVVALDGRGVEIRAKKGATTLPWKDITAWGLGGDYLWYEVRRGPRAILPFRVMADRAAVEAVFRAEASAGPSARTAS